MDTRRSPKTSSPLWRALLITAIALAPLAAAQAYVGPGAGLSLLGALWGLLAAVAAALLFVISWPLRRMRRRKREEKKAREAATSNRVASESTAAPASADDQAPRS